MTQARGARPRVDEEEVLREAERMRQLLPRALVIGAAMFPLFLLLELPMMAAEFPEVGWTWVIALRLVGSLCFVIGAAVALRAKLRPPWFLVTAATTVTATACVAACVSWKLGGTASPINDAMAFYFIGTAMLVPSPIGQSLFLMLPTYLAYFGLLIVLEHSAGGFTMTRGFGYDLIIQLGITLFAAAGAHRLWASRQQLYRARRLGRYRLGSLIGRGAMTEVWHATERGAGSRAVALKIVRLDQSFGRGRQQEFERQARAASKLTSEHTVAIYDYGASDDGLAWIAMESLQGQDLEAHVHAHGAITPRRAIHFAKQAALSLIEAHRRGLVHGDLGPSNLFVLDGAGLEDKLKVLDWGVARDVLWRTSTETRQRVRIGTPAVMAPEVMVGSISQRGDIYAFGVTLYWMLVGRFPWSFEADDLIWGAHRREQIIAPSIRRNQLFPAGLDALVLQCLAMEPDQRPSDVAAVLAALRAIPVEDWTAREGADRWADLRSSGLEMKLEVAPPSLVDAQQLH